MSLLSVACHTANVESGSTTIRGRIGIHRRPRTEVGSHHLRCHGRSDVVLGTGLQRDHPVRVGSQVAFEVAGESTGPAPRHYGTVSMTGTANLPRLEQALLVRKTKFAELWPPTVSTSVICLPMAELEGS